MARPCSVCRHPQLPEITVDIADGANDVAIAKRYGLGRSAMQRHRQHIGAPNSMAAAERKSAAFQALASLPSAAEVNRAYASITSRIDAIAGRAEAEGSLAVALVGLRELRVTVKRNRDSLAILARAPRSRSTPRSTSTPPLSCGN